MLTDRRVAQSALVETALATLEHYKERNVMLQLQLDEARAISSKMEADLVSARFAGQSHLATVESLGRINAGLVAAVREMKRAASKKSFDHYITVLAIGDMCDAALRQAGQS